MRRSGWALLAPDVAFAKGAWTKLPAATETARGPPCDDCPPADTKNTYGYRLVVRSQGIDVDVTFVETFYRWGACE